MPAACIKSVPEHRAEVIAAIRPLPPQHMDLDDADGSVLASDVTVRWPLLWFDSSAMDGYAVLARDVAGAAQAPITLPVEAEITAGDAHRRLLAPGTCMKITTGAPLPGGADAVVRAEWTDGGTRQAVITQPVSPGDSVRQAGSDAQPGDLLLAARTPLGPAQLWLLAAIEQHTVLARPRPRVTVLSGGNELAGPSSASLPGQIWESNSFILAAAARRLGCTARRHPLVRDDPHQVRAALHEAAGGADLVITSGGISMGGQHDVFKAVLRDQAAFSFCQVAMQPGKPQGFGTIGEPPTPILLLPGNPASAFVSFLLFAGPAVRALQGRSCAKPHHTAAVLSAPVRSPAGKVSCISAILDHGTGKVAPAGRSSHQLTALARANALIIVPPPVTALAIGDTAEVLELSP